MNTRPSLGTVRGRAVWFPPVACAGIIAVAVLVLLRARAELPDPVATHWGVGGAVDGVESFGWLVTFLVVMTGGLAVLLVLLGVATRQPRAMGPMAVAMTAFLAWLIPGVTLAQRGLSDAHDAPSSDAVMLPALLVAVVAGLLTWAATGPRGATQRARADALPAGAPRLRVPAGGAVAWSGHTRRSPAVLWAVFAVALVPIGVITAICASTGQWQTAVVMALPAVVALVAGALLAATVTVGRTGVRARGLGLVPIVSVPLESIESAEYVPDTGVLQYGGWGYRLTSDGTTALVTSSGPGLRVNRAGRGPVVITVDDAERAVAVVNTLVAQRDAVRGGA